MRRIAPWIALAASAAMVVFASIALAGGGRGAGPRPQGGDAGDFAQTLGKAGFTAAESKALVAVMETKQKAHLQLRQELDKLRQLASDPKATDDQLRKAIASYRRAMESTEQKLGVLDRGLQSRLSVRGQARALALGLLDNGFRRGPMMGSGGGGRRPGGRGGGGAGRQARRGAGGRPVSDEQ